MNEIILLAARLEDCDASRVLSARMDESGNLIAVFDFGIAGSPKKIFSRLLIEAKTQPLSDVVWDAEHPIRLAKASKPKRGK